ncbi:MAG: family 78 glycoside hydrolase catalytic domain [Sedimentisphaerales bacterium]|nr:family 78 glycoside hydrolase catalytic domain [Sedimentisphaerales bacterium]
MTLRVTRLRCEYLVDPLGIGEVKPRLSWNIESQRRGARQTAWRVRVASSVQRLTQGETDLWDSGRVEDDRTAHIEYAGAPLVSRMACHWQVQVWDEQGATAASEPAFWTMGLLEPTDWQAHWIAADPAYLARAHHAIESTRTEPGTPPWFRKTFEVNGPVKRATLYATARGLFECHLNGKRVGEDIFAPEWTDYDSRIQYRTYDVTEQVQSGANALGAVLGDGWYSGYVGWQETRGRYGLRNSLMLQLEIELENGTRQIVVTDDSWRCAAGPIVFSDFMMGETYDARHELDGWAEAGFDDLSWSAVEEVTGPNVPLVSQPSEPVRVVGTIEPVSVNEIRPGVFNYDLGQNISGWVRLRISGSAGTRVTLRHGERLDPDGTLYTENLRRAKATDVYVLRGKGEEVWQPRFTFHGFQYIEVSGLPSAPRAGAIIGCVVHSATPPAGTFECSHPLVNRLWRNAYWSQKDNFLSVPTDCPQRDERLGWMGDAQVFLRTATCNMDVAAFFTKWMVDVEDAQTPDGVFPDTAPRLREDDNFVGLDGLGGAAGWADAGVIVPWTIWRVYGDRRIIERYYDAMAAWLDCIERTNPDGIRRHELGNNYGDWLCIPSDTSFRTQSPMKTLLATAYWADDAAKLSRMAREIGRTDDADRFDAMFEHVRAAFQSEFVSRRVAGILPARAEGVSPSDRVQACPERSRRDARDTRGQDALDTPLTVETQTAYLLALAFDLLPEAVRPVAAEHLVENIKNLDWHLSTGFVGISHLNPTLTAIGRADVAWRLLLNEDYPSWLYPVRHGATTIWERWNGWTEEEGFFNPQMNSFNHYSLGSVGEWLYRCVAGIELDPQVNAFKHFVIRPYPGGSLAHARATYQSLYGTIESGWQRQGKALTLEVTIPANTAARVYVPSDEGTPVLEGDTPAEKAAGIKSVGREGSFTVYRVPAGRYRFTSTDSG